MNRTEIIQVKYRNPSARWGLRVPGFRPSRGPVKVDHDHIDAEFMKLVDEARRRGKDG